MPLKRNIPVFFVAGLLVSVVGLAGAAYLGSRNSQVASNEQTPVQNWVKGLRQLGITAIYPARENFYVGDVYATDFAPDGSMLNRTMKIAHVDTRAELDQAYKDLPSFPLTPENYSGATIVSSTDDIFQPPPKRTNLPIVAFPDISVSLANAQSGGAGLVGKLGNLLGFTRAAATTLKVRVPEAETYGLPASVANQLFNNFCHGSDQGSPNPDCTEKVVRELLFAKAGPNVLCRNEPGLSTADVAKNPDPVGLSFVYSVFLTRSIDYEYGADTSVAAAARAIIGSNPSQNKAGPITALNNQEKIASVTQAATSQIDSLSQGGRLQVASVSSNGTVLKSVYPRPVVIGYVALWKPPLDPDGECHANPVKLTSQPNKGGNQE